MLQANTDVNSKTVRRKLYTTSGMIRISMLSATALVLMILEFPLPIFPEFLKMDLSDIPAVIGTFAMGPLAGAIIELFKNLLKIVIGSKTGGIGELANFLVGVAYVIPLGIIYNKNKKTKSIVLGSIIAVISMIIFASVLNYFIFIPAFAKFFGAPIDAFVGMTRKVNPLVNNFKTMVIFSIAPFNLLKGIIISLVSFKLYSLLKSVL